ncbi:HAD-IIA family hydrolase [Campylobacter sp.]|uniref:HAD-IIA family hydrolase n=1 Tax=Campylobacter sp. TaxID=205 RepID=UPI002707FA3E|nr:HAD-IIA family hydrolase [Campylobacter sp.]
MIFVDVQGTLISDKDKSPINGAIELIEFLNLKDIPYVAITNNTKLKSEDFLKDLRAKGLNIKDGAYIDPFYVLEEILPVCKIAAFGSDKFQKTVLNLGYELDFSSETKAVVIANGNEFKFSDFAQMIELLQGGARLIAMSETSFYKKDDMSYPGAGAIARMLDYATGSGFDVVGKPSDAFYKAALDLLRAQGGSGNFSDVTIISDDAICDLVGAKEIKMKTALVLSGKVKSASTAGVDLNLIDKIYADVSEVLKELHAKYK